MITNKKRIRSLLTVEKFVKQGNKFTVGVSDISRFENRLKRIGFSVNLNSGETVLPAPIGKVSFYNAEGKYIVRRDLPMEKSYSSREWHWQEFNGPYDRVERSKIVDVPHDRYPRTFIQPPSIELTVANSSNGDKIITVPAIEFSKDNEESIIHRVNLILELFGECQFFTEDLKTILNIPFKRLNWTILPLGEMPWNRLKNAVSPLVKKAKKGCQPVIWHRLESISKYGPDFGAVGHGGFAGYIVLGFRNKKIFMLESIYYGNATYVFGEDWKELSQKTKAEVLNEKLQKERIIHREGWDNNIDNLIQDSKERK